MPLNFKSFFTPAGCVDPRFKSFPGADRLVLKNLTRKAYQIPLRRHKSIPQHFENGN